MGVLILTLLSSLFLGGGLWFLLGDRFELDLDKEKNSLLNFLVFLVGTLPISFVLIFFGLGSSTSG
jgi:hypothetical protein